MFIQDWQVEGEMLLQKFGFPQDFLNCVGELPDIFVKFEVVVIFLKKLQLFSICC